MKVKYLLIKSRQQHDVNLIIWCEHWCELASKTLRTVP